MSLEKDTLNELFRYKNGKLYRRVATQKNEVGSEVTGAKDKDGYLLAGINGRMYRIHRVIYIMHHGHIPNRAMIDHINGIKDDNRIENLRALSNSHNQWNRHVDTKGYRLKHGKYEAQIRVNGKKKYLGRFATEEEARVAYLKAKKQYHVIKEIV